MMRVRDRVKCLIRLKPVLDGDGTYLTESGGWIMMRGYKDHKWRFLVACDDGQYRWFHEDELAEVPQPVVTE